MDGEPSGFVEYGQVLVVPNEAEVAHFRRQFVRLRLKAQFDALSGGKTRCRKDADLPVQQAVAVADVFFDALARNGRYFGAEETVQAFAACSVWDEQCTGMRHDALKRRCQNIACGTLYKTKGKVLLLSAGLAGTSP